MCIQGTKPCGVPLLHSSDFSLLLCNKSTYWLLKPTWTKILTYKVGCWGCFITHTHTQFDWQITVVGKFPHWAICSALSLFLYSFTWICAISVSVWGKQSLTLPSSLDLNGIRWGVSSSYLLVPLWVLLFSPFCPFLFFSLSPLSFFTHSSLRVDSSLMKESECRMEAFSSAFHPFTARSLKWLLAHNGRCK